MSTQIAPPTELTPPTKLKGRPHSPVMVSSEDVDPQETSGTVREPICIFGGSFAVTIFKNILLFFILTPPLPRVFHSRELSRVLAMRMMRP